MRDGSEVKGVGEGCREVWPVGVGERERWSVVLNHEHLEKDEEKKGNSSFYAHKMEERVCRRELEP